MACQRATADTWNMDTTKYVDSSRPHATSAESIQQFKNTMFSVPTDSGPLILLPQKFVDEVKTLSDKHANFRNSFEFVSPPGMESPSRRADELSKWFLNAHTNIGGQEQHQLALIHAAKHHLTKHRDLEKLLGAVQEELEFAFKEELPQTAGT